MFSLIIPPRRRPCLDKTLRGAGFLPKKIAVQEKLQISEVELSRALVSVAALSLQTHPHVQLHGFALMRVSRRNPHRVDPLLPRLRQRLQHQSRSIR